MKQVTINQKIIPAIEREVLWHKGDYGKSSRKEQLKAVSIYLLRFIVIATLLLTVLNSCVDAGYFPCEKPALPETAETRTFSGFTGVDIQMGARVYIYKGDVFEVEIIAPENFLDLINTRVSGGVLKIGTDRCLRSKSNDVKIFITMPELSTISMSGSGSIELKNTFSGSRLDATIYGSGNIFGGINYQTLKTRISGSGNIELAGYANFHDAAISGSGNLFCYPLDTKRAEVAISGSGSAFILVRDQLKARVSGSGSIFYKGNPWIQTTITGSGKIIWVH